MLIFLSLFLFWLFFLFLNTYFYSLKNQRNLNFMALTALILFFSSVFTVLSWRPKRWLGEGIINFYFFIKHCLTDCYSYPLCPEGRNSPRCLPRYPLNTLSTSFRGLCLRVQRKVMSSTVITSQPY